MLPISNSWRGIRYRIYRDISFKRTAIAWQKALGNESAIKLLREDISNLNGLLRVTYDIRRRRQKDWKWRINRYVL